MPKKIIICGGGPCGLICAYLLRKKGYSITLIERASNLGGCWKVNWEKELFTEHSPRVLSTNYYNFFKLMKELKIPITLNGVYAKDAYQTKVKIMKFAMNNLSFLDLLKLGSYITLSLFGHHTNLTVQEWMNKVDLSKKGRFFIRIMSILFADVPRKVLFDIFIRTIYGANSKGNLVQFKYSDRWIYLFEKKLKKLQIKILKKEKVISLQSNQSKIISCRTNKRIIYGDYFILCTPPNGLKNILAKSNDSIKSNWMSWSRMKHWCDYSIYNSFSFQLHFNHKVKYPEEWCTFCHTKWEIIVLPTSNFNKDFTRNPTIKTVWSCTIIDLAPLRNLTRIQVINEALHQLSNSINKPLKLKPTFVTISEDVIKTKKGWKSKNVGFVCTKLGILPMKGKRPNLFSVGPHNTREISTLEVATNQAITFCKNFLIL